MNGSRPPKVYRGSIRRLRKIRLRDSWSMEMLLLVAWVLFLLFVVIPWMARQTP
jgi:hypothetical protein